MLLFYVDFCWVSSVTLGEILGICVYCVLSDICQIHLFCCFCVDLVFSMFIDLRTWSNVVVSAMSTCTCTVSSVCCCCFVSCFVIGSCLQRNHICFQIFIVQLKTTLYCGQHVQHVSGSGRLMSQMRALNVFDEFHNFCKFVAIIKEPTTRMFRGASREVYLSHSQQ